MKPGGLDAKPGVATCSADADCRAAAELCDHCNCVALAKDGVLPKCPGGKTVACVMDPCRGKRAVCTAGKCALSDSASM